MVYSYKRGFNINGLFLKKKGIKHYDKYAHLLALCEMSDIMAQRGYISAHI